MGDYDNYINHKLKIFNHHTSSDIAIINKTNKDSYDACIKNNSIYYNQEKVIDLSDIRVKGNHNYENIMCAIIATKTLGINDTIKEVLSKFTWVEHRIEFVKKVNGREFSNDSKATNVKSTITALSSFKTLVILLLGGLDS